MAHAHSVYDCDTHFKIDPITRNITNVGSGKTTVLQYDHNSERFTFELPRYVEGHDMMGCNRVEVHYINIDSQTKQESKGLYEVQDLQTSPESDDVVICSWLISGKATKYAGSLVFLVRFACILDGNVEYSWNTAIYSNIRVSSGIYNSEEIIAPYPDVLQQWADEFAEHKGIINIVDQGFSDNDTLKVTETTLKVEYTDGTNGKFKVYAHYGKDGSSSGTGSQGVAGTQMFNCNVAITGSPTTVDVQDLDALSHSQPRTQPLAGDLVYVVIDGNAYFYYIDSISGTTATLRELCQLNGGGSTPTQPTEQTTSVVGNAVVGQAIVGL